MKKRYVVVLKRQERRKLEQLVKRGKAKATEIRRANILLKADANGPRWTDVRIADAFGCSVELVENVRQRYVARGLEGAVKRKKQEKPSRERILDGRGEARVLALACSKAPGGRSHWALRMLTDRVVELQIADEISYETVRRTLKKTR
jgi:hypothetical protein